MMERNEVINYLQAIRMRAYAAETAIKNNADSATCLRILEEIEQDIASARREVRR